MEIDYTVIVSSKAEEFEIFFPGKTCLNLMQVDFDKIQSDYVLYIERDYYKGFDFNYFLNFEIDKVNLGLIEDTEGNWPYSFDANYSVSSTEKCFHEKFSFSGVALFEREFFLKEFGLDFMMKAHSVARSIPCPKNVSKTTEKAIFLDRDGILIEDTSYPHKKEDLKLNKKIIPILNLAKKNNFKLIVVTNQSGIARGKFSEEQYNEFSNLMVSEFLKHEIQFDGIYHCPYHEEGTGSFAVKSFLRKPWAGMLIRAIEDHNIDITQSFMLGDKDSDVISAPLLNQFIIEGNYQVTSEFKVNSFDEALLKLKSFWIL